jgi:hypothetical protein
MLEAMDGKTKEKERDVTYGALKQILMFSQLHSWYERKGGLVQLINIITAAVHHECDLLCAWYKNSYVVRNKFVSEVKSIHAQCYDRAISYSTQFLFTKSSLKTQNHSQFHKN